MLEGEKNSRIPPKRKTKESTKYMTLRNKVKSATRKVCKKYLKTHVPVSYTHLDVYKRQVLTTWGSNIEHWLPLVSTSVLTMMIFSECGGSVTPLGL